MPSPILFTEFLWQGDGRRGEEVHIICKQIMDNTWNLTLDTGYMTCAPFSSSCPGVCSPSDVTDEGKIHKIHSK
jgi:hypothetical protein